MESAVLTAGREAGVQQSDTLWRLAAKRASMIAGKDNATVASVTGDLIGRYFDVSGEELLVDGVRVSRILAEHGTALSSTAVKFWIQNCVGCAASYRLSFQFAIRSRQTRIRYLAVSWQRMRA